MSDPSGSSKPPRQYPGFWEKGVPILLGILGLALVILLVIILVVATGLTSVH